MKSNKQTHIYTIPQLYDHQNVQILKTLIIQTYAEENIPDIKAGDCLVIYNASMEKEYYVLTRNNEYVLFNVYNYQHIISKFSWPKYSLKFFAPVLGEEIKHTQFNFMPHKAALKNNMSLHNYSKCQLIVTYVEYPALDRIYFVHVYLNNMLQPIMKDSDAKVFMKTFTNRLSMINYFNTLNVKNLHPDAVAISEQIDCENVFQIF